MKNNNCVIAARPATSSWSRKAPACRPEPIRQAQGKLRAKRVVEGSIVAIFLAMFLTACGDSSGDSKGAAPEVVDPSLKRMRLKMIYQGALQSLRAMLLWSKRTPLRSSAKMVVG